MRIIELPSGSTDIHSILEQARQDDLIVRSPDGTEFLLSAVDDFDRELALTRRNERLMQLLDIRARQTDAVPLDEVKRQLGMEG